MDQIDFENVEIVPVLPDSINVQRGDPLPEGIVRSTIVQFGAFPVAGAVEGGGLVIDYRPAGEKKVKRVVLAFNDLGMWLRWPCPSKCPQTPDDAQQ